MNIRTAGTLYEPHIADCAYQAYVGAQVARHGGLMIDFVFAQVESLEEAGSAEGQALDAAILGEQFYFFTVVLMWLIHVGFMSYEAGAVRRKNVLATAMKNITLIFFLAFLLFSWTPASIMSGATLKRIRLSAYLVLAAILGSVVWILDAAWGWSAGGWMTMRFGFHDSIASGVVHGVAGAFALGVLFNLGPRIGKYTRDGLARTFRPQNLHVTLMGLMLIFTGFYAFYAACLVIASTTF